MFCNQANFSSLYSQKPHNDVFAIFNWCVQWQTSVPQEFLKNAIPDYLVRGTDPFSLRLSNKKMTKAALAGVAQWIERQPVNQRVTGLIPSQGTCLGYGPGPQ